MVVSLREHRRGVGAVSSIPRRYFDMFCDKR